MSHHVQMRGNGSEGASEHLHFVQEVDAFKGVSTGHRVIIVLLLLRHLLGSVHHVQPGPGGLRHDHLISVNVHNVGVSIK